MTAREYINAVQQNLRVEHGIGLAVSNEHLHKILNRYDHHMSVDDCTKEVAKLIKSKA